MLLPEGGGPQSGAHRGMGSGDFAGWSTPWVGKRRLRSVDSTAWAPPLHRGWRHLISLHPRAITVVDRTEVELLNVRQQAQRLDVFKAFEPSKGGEVGRLAANGSKPIGAAANRRNCLSAELGAWRTYSR